MSGWVMSWVGIVRVGIVLESFDTVCASHGEQHIVWPCVYVFIRKWANVCSASHVAIVPNTRADTMINIVQTVLVIVNIRLAVMSKIRGIDKYIVEIGVNEKLANQIVWVTLSWLNPKLRNRNSQFAWPRIWSVGKQSLPVRTTAI